MRGDVIHGVDQILTLPRRYSAQTVDSCSTCPVLPSTAGLWGVPPPRHSTGHALPERNTQIVKVTGLDCKTLQSCKQPMISQSARWRGCFFDMHLLRLHTLEVVDLSCGIQAPRHPLRKTPLRGQASCAWTSLGHAVLPCQGESESQCPVPWDY